jgi:hypothetical protein
MRRKRVARARGLQRPLPLSGLPESLAATYAQIYRHQCGSSETRPTAFAKCVSVDSGCVRSGNVGATAE